MSRTISGPSPADGPFVLIVGAGPTGLTLAVELARRNVAFRIVEASPVPQAGSRGKGVQPRTLEVLNDLGVVDRVLRNGRMGMPMEVTGADGQVRLNRPASLEPRPDVPYAASLVTPEWRIEETLRLRLAELGGTVDFGTTLAGFEQYDDGLRAVLSRDGTGDEDSETVMARWLIGCDGGHSVVRRLAGVAFEGDTRENLRMIVADVHVDGLDREAWHLWQGAEGMVSLCPLPSTEEFQYQASIAPGQDPDLALANLQYILDRRSGQAAIRIGRLGWTSLWRANVRLVDRYRVGRVLLAGDAAHIHSPAGGQGMITGIQDAHNLGWKLAAVADGADPALIDTYEAERRPVAAGVLALSDARLAEAAKERTIPTRRDASTTQLGISYRDSVLAQDDRDDTATLRAGDRAPDASGLATTEGERRLFDLTRGGRFTLLSFGRAPEVHAGIDLRVLSVVVRPVEAGDVADVAGHLTEAYQASEPALVLIRPDGYVGLISDAGDPRAVTDYLAGLVRPGPHSAPAVPGPT